MTEDEQPAQAGTPAEQEPRDQPVESPEDTSEPTRPFLRIVRGNPTPEETAAVVTVMAALATAGAESPRRPVSEWSAHHRKTTRTLPHGPGGWRSSALPR